MAPLRRNGTGGVTALSDLASAASRRTVTQSLKSLPFSNPPLSSWASDTVTVLRRLARARRWRKAAVLSFGRAPPPFGGRGNGVTLASVIEVTRASRAEAAAARRRRSRPRTVGRRRLA